MKTHVVLFLIIFTLSLGLAPTGCGGGSNNGATAYSEGWGVEDEVEPYFVYFREDRDDVQVNESGDELIIRDNINEIVAFRSEDGNSYSFSGEHYGISVSCQIDSDVSPTLQMNCIINGQECRYVMEEGIDGYEEVDDDCKDVFKASMDAEKTVDASTDLKQVMPSAGSKSDGGGDEGPWDYECGRYAGSSPATCHNVVYRNGIKYYHRESCTNDHTPITASDNSVSDQEEVLRILRIYSDDEKEGCFLFVCNGPYGNFHFVIMPYNPELLQGSSLENAAQIRDAYDDAPVAYHTLLPGPYAKDNQCEWYETDEVGAQDVYYNDKAVWDWNDFCIDGRCPYKLMFAIYESDEERKWYSRLAGIRDDYVGYGVIKRSRTLDRDDTFYKQKFKMYFRTHNYELPSGSEFIDESKKYEFVKMYPSGYDFGASFIGASEIYQDPWNDNVMWVGAMYRNEGGKLLRWDHKGTLYDPSDDVLEDYSAFVFEGDNYYSAAVEDIKGDAQNGLWFACGLNNATHMDPSGQWTRHSWPGDAMSIEMGLDDEVYVGSNGTLSKYDGGEWESLVTNVHWVKGLELDADGTLWFGHYAGTFSGPGGVFKVMQSGELVKQDFFWEEGLNEDTVLSIFEESSKYMWFGTWHNAVYVWDRVNNTTQNIRAIFDEEPVSDPPDIQDMHMDDQGRLWVVSGQGVAFIDRDFIPHNFGSYEPASSLDAMTEDRFGHLWFGGAHTGLYLLTEKPE